MAGVKVKVGAAVMTALVEFPIPTTSKEFSCWPAFDCGSQQGLLNCNRILQARMPSYHVCSRLELPALPQFLNQEPPRPQQLRLPDFSMVPHLKHNKLLVVVVVVVVFVTAGIDMQRFGQRDRTEQSWLRIQLLALGLELTFAGLHTLRPPVISVSVVDSSAVL